MNCFSENDNEDDHDNEESKNSLYSNSNFNPNYQMVFFQIFSLISNIEY